MRFVKQPLIRGQVCAVTGKATDEKGFIHTNRILAGLDPEIFVSHRAVVQMGKKIGMVTPEEIDELQKRLGQMGDEIAELRGKVEIVERAEQANRELEAVIG